MVETLVCSNNKKGYRLVQPYKVFRFFPHIDVVDLGGIFCNTGSLPVGIFGWLQHIRPSHLVYCSGDICELASYFPSRFARQFSYDLLYMGNLCKVLAHYYCLIDVARVLRYFIMSSTGVTFRMPAKDPSLLTT